ncbi:hypothetical protein [Pseudonocardia sp. TRM90224]|uniref:hypothetical protein n=1 Tax=Pseudonocardia sp. TRM90224 TaxID=2812678 RepID=UPI001E43804E|nr:hypothetical protein [Pseudonocardia sp. TRM90224]
MHDGPPPFTVPELGMLREHGIAFFAGRVVHDAQPPITAESLEFVQDSIAGPIPPGLLDLWRTTAGGQLAYDLEVTIGGQPRAFGWSELFFQGSDGYYDLHGWIEQELEGNAAGRLDLLPIGGFEYLDRVYVVVDPESSGYGQVVAFMGATPAWTGGPTEDSAALLATDLSSAFAALRLDAHPLPDGEADVDATGIELVEYLDVRCSDDGLPESLAQRVIDFYALAAR